MLELDKIYCIDVMKGLQQLDDESIDCCITSPPYFALRNYNVDGQIGLEKTLEQYLRKLLLVTEELHRVLKKNGTLWWNHGDSYSNKNCGKGGGWSVKPKDYPESPAQNHTL